MIPVPPGRSPIKKPIRDPLPIGPADLFQSWRLGNRSQNLGVGRTVTGILPVFHVFQGKKNFADPEKPHDQRDQIQPRLADPHCRR